MKTLSDKGLWVAANTRGYTENDVREHLESLESSIISKFLLGGKEEKSKIRALRNMFIQELGEELTK